ncbi:asparagine synthase-related protein [Shimazuella kribbensis]|uniref:asparagine synthase-related protein n=1 Tax=Shimazuella kribbensis TaxID=139808 RepID=UPI0003F542F2|nr:asparagine synthase-related protein [Shimazuella kribbensis]
MFFSSYQTNHLVMDEILDHYVYHKDGDAECYFIGEILSDQEATYHAFQEFQRTLHPHTILFLRGNYQTIIRVSNELWLFSDLGNVRPIYYTKKDKQWLISSHLTRLNDIVDSPFNTSWFRRSLSTSGFHIETETPFQKIQMVPGGMALYINSDQDRVDFFQAWNIDMEENLSWEMAQNELNEELTASVALRCQNKKITSDLSGGLDSSTITCIASKENLVKSVTIIGKEENEDGEIAQEIAKIQKNIKQTLLSQGDIPSIYSHMDRFRGDSPISFLWSANKTYKIIQWAKENKSDIHFSGEGGDIVLEADHSYLVDLIFKGKWKTFYSHIRGWADVKKQSPLTWLIGSFRVGLGLPFKPKQRHPLALTHNSANWLNFSTSIKKFRYSKCLGVSNTIHGIHYLGYISSGLRNLAKQEQVNMSFPYLDHNVLRTCIRTLPENRMDPYELKPLLKRSFHSDLPSCLLNRNTKGNYTADVYHGMEQNYSWFHKSFREMHLSEMGLVDKDKFRECFHRLLIGAPVRLPEFNQTLALEMWLRQFKQERG